MAAHHSTFENRYGRHGSTKDFRPQSRLQKRKFLACCNQEMSQFVERSTSIKAVQTILTYNLRCDQRAKKNLRACTRAELRAKLKLKAHAVPQPRHLCYIPGRPRTGRGCEACTTHPFWQRANALMSSCLHREAFKFQTPSKSKT